jgi:hexosaminidase
MMEVDMPGHGYSWGIGYPEITTDCPSYESNVNNIPLDPSLNETYEIVYAVLADVNADTTDSMMHLGGDEVCLLLWQG